MPGGLVVAPGFIDIHRMDRIRENQIYKVMDGVTTALELEMGTADVDNWYEEREGEVTYKPWSECRPCSVKDENYE